jgi:hypothetical protein
MVKEGKLHWRKDRKKTKLRRNTRRKKMKIDNPLFPRRRLADQGRS